jgi:hypothetical protein
MWKIRQGQKMSRERKLQKGVLAHMWCKRIILNHRRRKPARCETKEHYFFQEEEEEGQGERQLLHVWQDWAFW